MMQRGAMSISQLVVVLPYFKLPHLVWATGRIDNGLGQSEMKAQR
jgi:hypothetical protein